MPSIWKTEVKEESSSSEEDDDDEEEEQEEDASGEEEEVETAERTYPLILQPPRFKKRKKREMPNCLVSCLQEEVEPFPEERENFLQQLYKFMEDRGESRAGTSVMFEVYFHL